MKHTILIIEDDELVRRFISRFMTHLGHDFIVANDGIEGLKAFIDNPAIDRVLTDKDMPRMNGIQVIKAIRLVSSVHICLMSGGINTESKAEAFAAGANVVLEKPMELDSLLNALNIE